MTANRLLVRLGTALIAAVLLLTVASATARPVAAQTSGLVLAFTGTVDRGPSKGTTLAGDLNIAVGPDGRFDGGLVTDTGEIPVEGRLVAGNLSITFILGQASFIFGIGQVQDNGSVRGSFIGPQAGDGGRWVADPITNLSLDFRGTVERGPSKGTTLAGPLFLKIAGGRFTGLLKIADGTSVPVTGRLSTDDKQTRIAITFALGQDVTIVGNGTQTTDGGFAGRFRGPATGDRGSWKATPSK
jgi:hypothetical protein